MRICTRRKTSKSTECMSMCVFVEGKGVCMCVGRGGFGGVGTDSKSMGVGLTQSKIVSMGKGDVCICRETTS